MKLNLSLYLIIALVLTIFVLTISVNQCSSNKRKADTQAANLQTKNDSIQFLTLTIKQYKNLSFKDKSKFDSLFALMQTKPRLLERATITSTKYKDTTKVAATVGKPIIVPNIASNRDTIKPLYCLPVSFESKCWGMDGELITTDPNVQLNILNQSFNTVQSVVITRQKRFLGFLFITQRRKVIAKTTCGESEIDDITFTK